MVADVTRTDPSSSWVAWAEYVGNIVPVQILSRHAGSEGAGQEDTQVGQSRLGRDMQDSSSPKEETRPGLGEQILLTHAHENTNKHTHTYRDKHKHTRAHISTQTQLHTLTEIHLHAQGNH